MYSEQVNVLFPYGLHGETLWAIGQRFPSGVVLLNGIDPTDTQNIHALYGAKQVTITVDTGNPQTDKDVFDIVRGIANLGHDPWRGRAGLLPAHFYSQAADWMRSNSQFGLQNDSMEMLGSAPVNIDMSTQSSFTKEAPGKEHMKGVSPKRNRQYEHIKQKYLEEGKSEEEAKELAARTVNKQRAEHGETKEGKDKDEKWIQKAIKRPGQLHKDLGIPEDENIPEEKLQEALHSDDPKVRQRAQFAINVKKKKKKSDKLSMWSVVALGELQQPGGVGATQEPYNPILDGPNPDGPNFEDNAQNSQEQEMALQTWVNHAINMLNRGDDPEVVLAQLAHDGCPEPKAVLDMALNQPEKEDNQPVTDQIGQDPFEVPMPEDGQTGQMQDVSRQPPVVQAKRVRIANTSLTGVELERWEDLWGQGIVKVALDDGGTLNVSPDAIEDIGDEEVPEHPVSQIQKFIDGLPKVEPTRPHIQARIDNLELVRKAIRSTISKVGFSDQVKLSKIDMDAQAEIMTLKESLGAIVSESDMAYLDNQQRYRFQGLDLPGVERVTVENEEFNRKIAEKAAIFVSELPDEMINDPDAVAYAAMNYASQNNGDVQKFMYLAEKNRVGMKKERVL
jgi:hypothetical protein